MGVAGLVRTLPDRPKEKKRAVATAPMIPFASPEWPGSCASNRALAAGHVTATIPRRSLLERLGEIIRQPEPMPAVLAENDGGQSTTVQARC
jgi:hypothetical protein